MPEPASNPWAPPYRDGPIDRYRPLRESRTGSMIFDAQIYRMGKMKSVSQYLQRNRLLGLTDAE